MKLKISIIIPTHNAAESIESCLKSIQRQKFDNFEVHVIDANSSDGTMQIIEKYAGKVGQNLGLNSSHDKGVYDAMNKGVSVARGEWIYFMGADDKLHDEDVLANFAQHMAKNDIDFVYGDVLLKKNNTRYGGCWSLDKLLFVGNICQQSIFYRRNLFDNLGKFNLRYPIWADWEFNIRCFRNPELNRMWVNRIVAIYNESSGLSSLEDNVFIKELPVFLLKDLEEMKSRIRDIKCKKSYKIGKKFFGWLDG